MKEQIYKILNELDNPTEKVELLYEILIELRHSLKGYGIIKYLQDCDRNESYGWTFYYVLESLNDDKSRLVIWFDIEYGHYIPQNYIEIDLEKGICLGVKLNDPFENCGAESEITELLEQVL